jgi:FG-GAP-like repeat
MRALVFGLLFLGVIGYSCKRGNPSEITTPVESNLTGEELAKIHCAGCHVFPDPKSLPKAIWLSGVLPKMGLRLGQGEFMLEMMNYSNDEMMAIMNAGVYPQNPTIAKADWEKIVKYYAEKAPDSLDQNRILKTKELLGFGLKEQKVDAREIVLTQFDSTKNQISIGTSVNSSVYSLSENRQLVDSIKTKSPVVDLKYHKNLGKVALEVGILNPSDLSEGRLIAGNKVLIDKLHRPVNMVLADLNDDNYEDFIIANFGNLFGNLTWYDGKTFKENTLINEPGARVVYHVDFDKDGKKDILALMTQGRESIVLFRNKGNGEFEMKTLLSFPPYFGSSYFESKDLDFDGDLDFVYTNGDNADLSIVKKPFHGVRIYLNNGNAGFKEKYFYPINGASKVLVEDFDKDRDFDMAVISFFPDNQKNEGFLYFEGQANFNFEVSSKKKVSSHKWLTMDVGDFDKDGDKDIVLGAFNRGLTEKVNVSSVVVLENLLKK